ncbi:MAG: HAAS signaling domain-containing protein [Actinomycetes bacterium]
MTTTTRSREAQDFLDGVAAQLADLPQDDRADLLDEVAGHVDEVAAESNSPLESRLGSPEHYAAELRTSAGLPPALVRTRAGSAAVARLRAFRQRPAVIALVDFLTALRPAWWVLRAWVAVGLVAMFPGQTTPTWSLSMPVVPRVATPTVGLLIVLAVTVVSVQFGRHGRHVGNAVRRAVIVANVVTALALLPVLSSMSAASHAGDTEYYAVPQYVERVPAEGVYAGGRQVWNIYAYDAAGTMLHDVRLYDHDGTPLSLALSFDATKRQSLDTSGQQVDNAFPYRYIDPDSGVVENENAAPPIVAPPLVGFAQ